MSIEPPPEFFFNGIHFNSSYYQEDKKGITKSEANSTYLRKLTPDTATALETFNSGIKTDNIQTILNNNNLNIGTNTTADINIGDTNANLNLRGAVIDVGADAVGTTLSVNSRLCQFNTPSVGSANYFNALYNQFTHPITPFYNPSLILSSNIGGTLEATNLTGITSAVTILISLSNIPEGVWLIDGHISPNFPVASGATYFNIGLSTTTTFDNKRSQFVHFPVSGTIPSQITSVFTLTSTTTVNLICFSTTIATNNVNNIKATRLA